MTMNKLYRRVAEKLTDWENHETKIGHENSLIIKRFLFEAFDAYGELLSVENTVAASAFILLFLILFSHLSPSHQ